MTPADFIEGQYYTWKTPGAETWGVFKYTNKYAEVVWCKDNSHTIGYQYHLEDPYMKLIFNRANKIFNLFYGN